MSDSPFIQGVSAEPKGLSDDQVKRLLASEISDALQYLDSTDSISNERYRNWEYYRGIMNDLPVIKGQSSVVSSEVSDYIGMMLPSLLRPFTSGDRLWDYSAPGGLNEQVARQISDYINEVVWKKDNRGEIILNNWAFDGLVQKNGIVKAWWVEETQVQDETYEGLNDAQWLVMSAGLALDQSKSITAYDEGPNGRTVTIRTTKDTSHVCITPIPIAEFVISKDARDMESAILRCHRTWYVAGDLISDGYPPDIVNRLPTYTEGNTNLTLPGAQNRETSRQNFEDPMLRKVTVYEGIIRCDRDGSGVREWYFKAGGQDGGVELLECELYHAQIFFCEFCPEPIPHQFVGTCPADRLAMIQKVNTVLTRQMLQKQYLSNAPQREVVADWILSPDQLMNFAAGASIMVQQPGAIRNLELPTGAEALPIIQYYDGKASDRSGVSRTSAGLDPDALQNQSATSANLAWNASMGRLEMIARIWAYTGMRQLGTAILKLVIAYQNTPRNVLLGGKPVTIDPRQWGPYADMEVNVTTGLGTGHRDRDVAFLNNLLGLQQMLYQTFGPTPIVDTSKIVNTMQRLVEAGGISNVEAYIGSVPPGWQAQPIPKPDPKMLDVQSKAAEMQARYLLDAAKAQKEQELKTAQAVDDAQRERDIAATKANLELEKLRAEHQLKLQEMEKQFELEEKKLEKEAQLELIAIKTKLPSGQGDIPDDRVS